MLDRISDCLSAAGDLQLREDIADVGFRRCEADDQCLGDLAIALALHDKFKNIHLSFGQVI